MIESISERQAIASQIKQMRELERTPVYRHQNWNRGIHEYLYYFNGLSRLLDYARELDGRGLVLDIGAGATKGISEIAGRRMGAGLNFEATVLTSYPEISKYLGLDRTHITSAEKLKGIEDNSVNLVLALNSIAYSASPFQTAKRIDEVLVSGGAIKAVFKHKNLGIDSDGAEYNYQTHDRFSESFRDLGYDVAISPSLQEGTMLAVKPAIDKKILASDLLRRDKGTVDTIMIKEGHL